MTTATDAQYERCAQACLEACRHWRTANPEARLKFRPLMYRTDAVVGCTLYAAIYVHAVAGNSITRKLLVAMLRATSNGATVLMADHAIHEVYGIESALTHKKN